MMDPCSECGTSVSSLAEVCPRCGVRFKPAPVPPRPLGVLDIGCGVFLGLLAWAIVAGFVGFVLFGAAAASIAGAARP